MMSTALLLVGAQLNMFEPEPVYQAEAVRQVLRELLQRARDAGVPVIFVQNCGGPGEPDEPGTPGWAIHPDLAPNEQEAVVMKTTPDSFYQTALSGLLVEQAAQRLVVAGMQTELCIDTAVRRAFSLGYEVALVADGHSTYDAAGVTAAQIIAHHNGVLRAFAAVTAAAQIDLEAPPVFTLDERLGPVDLAAIRAGLAEVESYERWLIDGDANPFWQETHPTRVTEALRRLWEPQFRPHEKPAPVAGWEMGLARAFIQPLSHIPGFVRRTAVQSVAQAIGHLLQSPTNPFAPQIRQLSHGLWSYDARDFRLIYMPRTVQDSHGRERKYVFLIWLAPALPQKNPFA
jgi:nicotinamidase-related amidase